MSKRIPFISPSFPSSGELGEDLDGIVKRNFYTNSGPLEQKLSAGMAAYLSNGAKVALVHNATLALLLAIKGLFKVGPKQVLVPSFTFAAGPEAILWSGYEPVFIDVEGSGWHLDIEAAENYIRLNRDRVAGVLLCNTFGVGNQAIGVWEALTDRFDLPLIIDSAAGFGSQYNESEKLGARGTCEIFSLHATKPFAIGEGGAVTSRSIAVVEKINQMKNFGFNHDHAVEVLGLNAKLPEFACAIGLRQLRAFDRRLKQRRQNLELYRDFLASSGVSFQSNDLLSAIPFVSILLPQGCDRDKLRQVMTQAGVETRSYYNPALHLQPLFKENLTPAPLEVTNAICRQIISLPMNEGLSKADIKRVASFVVAHVANSKS